MGVSFGGLRPASSVGRPADVLKRGTIVIDEGRDGLRVERAELLEVLGVGRGFYPRVGVRTRRPHSGSAARTAASFPSSSLRRATDRSALRGSVWTNCS